MKRKSEQCPPSVLKARSPDFDDEPKRLIVDYRENVFFGGGQGKLMRESLQADDTQTGSEPKVTA